MSDVEEALKFVDCSYIAANNSVIFPEANQKLQRTIKTALQEQAEREKGCEYCCPEATNESPIFSKHINGYWGPEKIDDTGDGTRANFCPVCGRDLRKPVEK